MDKKPRVFAYGGGVQSNAVLVLSASGILPYTHFVFANVGDDSENPATIKYINEVARPYAERHGLYIINANEDPDIHRTRTSVLNEALTKKHVMYIPASVNTVPSKRFCTSRYKIEVIESFMRKWLKATKKRPKPVGVGISLDEWQRAKRRNPYESVQVPEYPLLDLRYFREDCIKVIEAAGLPIPPKSSCWFCPYKKKTEWFDLYKNEPELFNKAVELETVLQQKFIFANVTLSSVGLKLPELIQNLDKIDIEDVNCESGYCLT